ncbi:DEAD/DEAH box helicase, partial [bacterium]
MISEGLFGLDDYVLSGAPLPKIAEKPTRVFLRPYQTECLQRVQAAYDRGLRRGLAVMATGLGKTTLFSELIRQAVADGRKVLVIAHQIELLDQAADRIRSMCPGVKVGIQGGEHKAPWNSQVVVAGNQSLGRAKDPIPWFTPSLIVVDECHHAAAESYMIIFRRYRCWEPDGAQLLGVTATPHRLDNRPLHGNEKAIFEEVLFDMALARAIREGWLCDLRAFRVAASMDLRGVKKAGGDFNQKQLQE